MTVQGALDALRDALPEGWTLGPIRLSHEWGGITINGDRATAFGSDEWSAPVDGDVDALIESVSEWGTDVDGVKPDGSTIWREEYRI